MSGKWRFDEFRKHTIYTICVLQNSTPNQNMWTENDRSKINNKLQRAKRALKPPRWTQVVCSIRKIFFQPILNNYNKLFLERSDLSKICYVFPLFQWHFWRKRRKISLFVFPGLFNNFRLIFWTLLKLLDVPGFFKQKQSLISAIYLF